MKKYLILFVLLFAINYGQAFAAEVNKLPKPEIKIETDCDKDAIINRLKCKKAMFGKSDKEKKSFKLEPGDWIKKGAGKVTEGLQKIQDTAPKNPKK